MKCMSVAAAITVVIACTILGTTPTTKTLKRGITRTLRNGYQSNDVLHADTIDRKFRAMYTIEQVVRHKWQCSECDTAGESISFHMARVAANAHQLNVHNLINHPAETTIHDALAPAIMRATEEYKREHWGEVLDYADMMATLVIEGFGVLIDGN